MYIPSNIKEQVQTKVKVGKATFSHDNKIITHKNKSYEVSGITQKGVEIKTETSAGIETRDVIPWNEVN